MLIKTKHWTILKGFIIDYINNQNDKNFEKFLEEYKFYTFDKVTKKELSNLLIDYLSYKYIKNHKIKWKVVLLLWILDFIEQLDDINSIHWLIKILNNAYNENFKWKYNLLFSNLIAKYLHFLLKRKIQNKTIFLKNYKDLMFTLLKLENKINSNVHLYLKHKWLRYHLSASIKELILNVEYLFNNKKKKWTPLSM